jgi:hypothetical protein
MGNAEGLEGTDEGVVLVLEDKPFFYVFHGTDQIPKRAGVR